MLDPLTNLTAFVQAAVTKKREPKLGLKTKVAHVLSDYGIENARGLVDRRSRLVYRHVRVFYSRYKHLLHADSDDKEVKQLAIDCDKSLTSYYKSAHAAYHDPNYVVKTMGQCASYHFTKNNKQCDKKVDPNNLKHEAKITPRMSSAYAYPCVYDKHGKCNRHAKCNTKWLC